MFWDLDFFLKRVVPPTTEGGFRDVEQESVDVVAGTPLLLPSHQTGNLVEYLSAVAAACVGMRHLGSQSAGGLLLSLLSST